MACNRAIDIVQSAVRRGVKCAVTHYQVSSALHPGTWQWQQVHLKK